VWACFKKRGFESFDQVGLRRFGVLRFAGFAETGWPGRGPSKLRLNKALPSSDREGQAPPLQVICYTRMFGAVPKWPKGEVCKTSIRGFESHPRLQDFKQLSPSWIDFPGRLGSGKCSGVLRVPLLVRGRVVRMAFECHRIESVLQQLSLPRVPAQSRTCN
jgi:hypothetical protein